MVKVINDDMLLQFTDPMHATTIVFMMKVLQPPVKS